MKIVEVTINKQTRSISEGQIRVFHSKGKTVQRFKEQVLSIQHDPTETVQGEVIKENKKTFIIRLENGRTIKRKINQCRVLEQTNT